jgi:hypothetical protein
MSFQCKNESKLNTPLFLNVVEYNLISSSNMNIGLFVMQKPRKSSQMNCEHVNILLCKEIIKIKIKNIAPLPIVATVSVMILLIITWTIVQ